MTELDPQINAEIAKKTNTRYIDSQTGAFLYDETEQEMFMLEGGIQSNRYVVPVDDRDLSLRKLDEAVKDQERDLRWLTNSPFRVRLMGYCVTGSLVFLDSLNDTGSIREKALNLGGLALAGVFSTEIIAQLRKIYIKDEVTSDIKRLDSLKYHKRRLSPKKVLGPKHASTDTDLSQDRYSHGMEMN